MFISRKAATYVPAGLLCLSCSLDDRDDVTSDFVGPSGGASASGGGSFDAEEASGGSSASGGVDQYESGGQSQTSSGGRASTTGEPLFVPDHITFMKMDHPQEGLDMVAATLRQGSSGLELHAKLRNFGPTGACSGSIAIDLFDTAQSPLGSFNAGLFGSQVYRIIDLNQIVGCIDVDRIGMAAIIDIPPQIELADVAYVIYRFTYFATEFFEGGLTPVEGFAIQELQREEETEQCTFSGTLQGVYGGTVENPSVTVFSLTAGGRPLNKVVVSRTEPILSGASWTFETSPVLSEGEDEMAFAVGAIQF